MNRNEYNKLKSEIIETYGKPEFELNEPRNESAIKLKELKEKFLQEKIETKKVAQLVSQAKRIKVSEDSPEMVIPEQLIKDSWLTPFTDEEKLIINTWMEDITLSIKDLAEKSGVDKKKIKKLLNSESFKYLEANLSQSYKKMMSLEAMNRLRRCLHSKDEKTVLTAAKLILLDAGLLKPDMTEQTVTNKTEIKLSEEDLERFRQLGDNVLGLEKEANEDYDNNNNPDKKD